MGPRLRLIRLRWIGQQGDKAAVDKEAVVVEAAVEGKSGGDNHFSLQTTSTPDHHSLPQTAFTHRRHQLPTATTTPYHRVPLPTADNHSLVQTTPPYQRQTTTSYRRLPIPRQITTPHHRQPLPTTDNHSLPQTITPYHR